MANRSLIFIEQAKHFLLDHVSLLPILKNSGYVLSGNLASQALTLIQGVLVARLLGVEGYGLMSTTILIVATLNNLLYIKVSDFVIKYLTEALTARDVQRAAFIVKLGYSIEASTSLISCSIIMVFAHWLSIVFIKDESSSALIQVYAISIIANIMIDTSSAILKVYKRFLLLSQLTVIAATMLLVCITVAYFSHASIYGVLIAFIITLLISALLNHIMALRLLATDLGADWWRQPLRGIHLQWRTLFGFLIHSNFNSAFILVNRQSDLIWLSALRNPIEVGYYKLATAITSMVSLPPNALGDVYYPELVSIYANRKFEQLRMLLHKGTKIGFMFAIAGGIGCMVLSAFGIPIFYGADFLPALPAIAILLAGLCPVGIFFWIDSAMLCVGRAHILNYARIGTTMLQIPLTLMLVSTYGYLGSALTITIVRVIQTVVLIVYFMNTSSIEKTIVEEHTIV